MRLLLCSPFVVGRRFVTTGRCQIASDPALGLWPPVDLAQLAAALAPIGDEIRIMDFALTRMGKEDAYARIARFRPDTVIAHSTTPTLNDDIGFFGGLKDVCGATVVFYGPHATARPEDFLSPAIPFAIRREPEETARALVVALGEGAPVDDVPGISFWRGGKAVNNPDREFIADLDSLPWPDRRLLENAKYMFGYFNAPFTVVQVSRGCPFSCSFCTCPMYYGSRWRCRSPQGIANEMESVFRGLGIKNFLLLSDTFNYDPGFVRGLCRAIAGKRLPLRWMCNSRCDRFDEPTAREMRKAGCFLVSFGVESSSDDILARCGKGTTPRQAADAVAAARRAGLRTVCYFLFGLPGETPVTAAMTADFALKLGCDYAYFYAATPFPGTRFYEEAVREGWIADRNWDAFAHGECVISLPAFPREELGKAVSDAHRRFYLDAGRIGREAVRAVADGRLRALWNGARFLGGVARYGRRDGKASRNSAG